MASAFSAHQMLPSFVSRFWCFVLPGYHRQLDRTWNTVKTWLFTCVITSEISLSPQSKPRRLDKHCATSSVKSHCTPVKTRNMMNMTQFLPTGNLLLIQTVNAWQLETHSVLLLGPQTRFTWPFASLCFSRIAKTLHVTNEVLDTCLEWPCQWNVQAQNSAAWKRRCVQRPVWRGFNESEFCRTLRDWYLHQSCWPEEDTANAADQQRHSWSGTSWYRQLALQPPDLCTRQTSTGCRRR